MKVSHYKKKKERSPLSCKGCYFKELGVNYCHPNYRDIKRRLNRIHGNCEEGHIYVRKAKFKVHWAWWFVLAVFVYIAIALFLK